MRQIFLSLLVTITVYAKDYIYFLPQDSRVVKEHIETLIKDSKKTIDIAMYNLEYKKFIKLLKKAKKNGVDVNIVYDKGSRLDDFRVKKLDKKLHTKLAIFDKKFVMFGSANWTKKSFNENYEVIYISDDKNLVDKFNIFFESLTR